MIKKVPTDGIRKKPKVVRAPVISESEIILEQAEDKLPESIPEMLQDSSDALERFMRRKSIPPEDADIPKEKSKKIETGSAPEGDILIIEAPVDPSAVPDTGGKKKRHMRLILNGALSRLAGFYKKAPDSKAGEYAEPERSGFISRPKTFLSVRGGVISGLGAVIVTFVLLSTVFARLTMYITPRAEQVTIRDVTILLDASVSKPLLDKKVIPVERLEFTQNASKEFETTGKEFVEERARGKVKIYNRFSSSPQGVVAHTRFLTDAGILYRLTSAITIPGAKIENGEIVPQFIEAELVADNTGTEANISGETRLSLPGFKGSSKYDGFYGIASGGFSGGFRGEARVVSKDDLSAAEKNVTKQIFDELRGEMKRKAPPEFKFVEELAEVEIMNVVSPRAGTRAERFIVEASARGRVLIFRERDIQDMLSFLIIGDNTSKKLVDESLELRYKIRSGDFQAGRAEVVIGGVGKIKTIISSVALAEALKGKKEGSIEETLKTRTDIAGFRASFFPPWRYSAPSDPGKIKIIVEGQ